MTSGGSACGGSTVPVRVIQANSVVDLKATPELPSAVALPDLRREAAYSTAGVRARCSDRQRNAQGERRAMRGMG